MADANDSEETLDDAKQAEKDRIATGEKYRDFLNEARSSNREDADKLIVTLASGLLALSLSFIKDLVPFGRMIDMPVLILSWLALGASILSTLISFAVFQKAVDADWEWSEAFYFENKDVEFPKKLRIWTFRVNAISAWCFVVGLCATILFVSRNAVHERNYQIRKARKVQMATDKPVPKIIDPRPGKEGASNVLPGTPPAPPKRTPPPAPPKKKG